MSLVDLQPAAEMFAALGQPERSYGPFDDGIALTDIERVEVRGILLEVAQRLTDRALSIDSMRRRLGAIVESLIAVADALDGDCEDEGAQCEDEGGQCEDEGSQCDDEGCPDDNGMADADGAAEQGFPPLRRPFCEVDFMKLRDITNALDPLDQRSDLLRKPARPCAWDAGRTSINRPSGRRACGGQSGRDARCRPGASGDGGNDDDTV